MASTGCALLMRALLTMPFESGPHSRRDGFGDCAGRGSPQQSPSTHPRHIQLNAHNSDNTKHKTNEKNIANYSYNA